MSKPAKSNISPAESSSSSEYEDSAEVLKEQMALILQNTELACKAHLEGEANGIYQKKIEAIDSLSELSEMIDVCSESLKELIKTLGVMPMRLVVQHMKGVARHKVFRCIAQELYYVAGIMEHVENRWNDMEDSPRNSSCEDKPPANNPTVRPKPKRTENEEAKW